MAVQLDTSKGTRDVKAQAEKDRNMKFLIVRVAVIVLTVLAIGNHIRVGIAGYREMKAADAKIEELNVAYDRVKAEAAAYHEQNDANKPVDESGMTVHTQAMYSAKAAGDEVAAIQTEYANEKMVMPSQQQRLIELTGNKNGWFGSEVKKPDPSNPESVRFDWEFLTFYDAQVTTYDCLWACWCSSADGTGSRYLVSVRMGRYNGETDSFMMSEGDTYISTFGSMVNKYGSIEAAQGTSQTTQDIIGAAGQLTESGLHDGEEGAPAHSDGTPGEGGGADGDGETGDGEGEGGGEDGTGFNPLNGYGDGEDIGNTSGLSAGNDGGV